MTHNLIDSIQGIYTLSVLFEWCKLFGWLLILLRNPFFRWVNFRSYVLLFLFCRVAFPFVLNFILYLVDKTFIFIFYIIQTKDVFIVLLELSLGLLHLLPALLSNLMKVIDEKATNHTLSTHDFVPIKHENNFIWRVDPQIADRLWSYLMFIIYIKLNNSLWAKIDDMLTWIATSPIKNNLFIEIIFVIFALKVIPLHMIPGNTNRCEVSPINLIKHIR
jgi:hypothetical protein